METMAVVVIGYPLVKLYIHIIVAFQDDINGMPGLEAALIVQHAHGNDEANIKF